MADAGADAGPEFLPPFPLADPLRHQAMGIEELSELLSPAVTDRPQTPELITTLLGVESVELGAPAPPWGFPEIGRAHV